MIANGISELMTFSSLFCMGMPLPLLLCVFPGSLFYAVRAAGQGDLIDRSILSIYRLLRACQAHSQPVSQGFYEFRPALEIVQMHLPATVDFSQRIIHRNS